MMDNDFGSVFSNSSSGQETDKDFIQIDLDELLPIQPPAPLPTQPTTDLTTIQVFSQQELAAQRYGVNLPDPEQKEELFVGVARNPDRRTEEEEYWPLFSGELRKRQKQIFTFEVEVSDESGNPIEYIPVELCAHEISGTLPGDGSPVAVYGSRDKRDGVVRTYKVINLRTRSSLSVKIYSKELCFVATAVYGSVDAPQVIFLRRFRDQKLMPTWWGCHLINVYYCYSPPLARWVAAANYRRNFARVILNTLIKGIRYLGDTTFD